MKRKKTKKALSGSVLALVLCFVMLIGTTFAWFTSSDSTAVNTIQAGTLKVALTDTDGKDLTDKALTWQKAADGKGQEILWEPGATYKTQDFKIANQGNLALKYKILLNGATGDTELLNAIDFKVVDSNNQTVALDTFEGHLSAGSEGNTPSATYHIEATMKTGAGNEYQGKKLDSIAITVVAGQYTEEYDSTSKMYDEKANISTVNPATTKMLLMEGSENINETLSINSNETGGNSDVIRVTGGNHTITGGTYEASGDKSNSCLRVDGGTVTIKGGTFTLNGTSNTIYAAGGNVVIEGGTFKSTGAYNNVYFTLNAQDNSGGTITVKGGSFWNFNPADAGTEGTTSYVGENEIIVPAGYTVTTEADGNGGTWYKVIEENTEGD